MTAQIDYQYSLVIGISKGLSGVVAGHPLDVIKTRCGAEQISPLPAVKSLFTEKGFRGFYSGITLNGSRIVLKESFRPLLLQFFQKLSSQNLSPLYQNTLYEQACIGLGIATVEMLYCPLEKLKVDFITNSAIRNSYMNFYQRYKGRLFQVAFQGVIPM
jgi:hypothetical protein